MESVLTAFVTIFITLFAVLTLSESVISAQDTLRTAQQQMQARLTGQEQIKLTPVNAQVTTAGTVVDFTLRNTGTARLLDFDRWDVFIQYYDTATPAVYHILRLPYSAADPAESQWSVEGIYLNSQQGITAAYEPGILGPGEQIAIQVKLNPPVARGTAIRGVFATDSGSFTSFYVIRNGPPSLAINTGLSVNTGGSGVITKDRLLAIDTGNLPQSLVYTVTTAPAHGKLSLGTTFTQDDVNSNLLTYTQTGGGNSPDNFQFTIKNEEATVGPFTFHIAVNAVPTLVTDAGLQVAAGDTGIISGALLSTTDIDEASGNLTYTVMQGPTQGTLSLDTTFTQADIDSGKLTYTQTGSGGDSFSFIISDGKATIGPFTFNISNPPPETQP